MTSHGYVAILFLYAPVREVILKTTSQSTSWFSVSLSWRAEVMVPIPHHFLVRNIKSLTTRSLLTQKIQASCQSSQVRLWGIFLDMLEALQVHNVQYLNYWGTKSYKNHPPISQPTPAPKPTPLHLCSFDLRANLFLAAHGWSLPSLWGEILALENLQIPESSWKLFHQKAVPIFCWLKKK